MSKTYKLRDVFLTLQGEGEFAGRAAVFCRFALCNLWSGVDVDRHKGAGACALWCDTDFTGGVRYGLKALVAEVVKAWGERPYNRRFVVLTGGEPGLQVDNDLVFALQQVGFFVAIETNGTCDLPDLIDHVTVSPKASKRPLVTTTGNVLNLVYPQPDLDPAWYLQLQREAKLAFFRHYLQPLDGPDKEANTRACVAYCLEHPEWSLSLQTHKLLGIP
mgnify:CR=1 FL=1